jgi:hypothetical protein
MPTLNATSTTREKACGLVLNGLQSITEGLLMYHELGFTTKEIYADLKAAGWDKSLRVLQRYQTELRKDGLLPKAYDSSSRFAKSGEIPVENSTPTITLENFRHQTDDSLSTPVQLLNATECIEPSVCYVQSNVGTDMGSDQEPVSMGTEAERDLATVYSLFDEIGRITGKYLLGGWSEGDWNGIGGECRTIEDGCNIHSANLRKRLKQESKSLGDSFTFDATGAPSLREGNPNNDE